MIATVLLQPGKTDAGALFTSNISSSAFGPRGTQTILSKITIAAAATFFISALLLAMPAITGNISVLQTVGETPADTQQANPADAQSPQSPVIDPQQNLLNTNTNAGDNNPANVNAAVQNTNVSQTEAGANSNAANANNR